MLSKPTPSQLLPSKPTPPRATPGRLGAHLVGLDLRGIVTDYSRLCAAAVLEVASAVGLCSGSGREAAKFQGLLPGAGSAFMSYNPPVRQLPDVTPEKHSLVAVVREFPHDRRSDADLVRDVVLGHEEALVAVWRRHAPAIRRTLYSQLGRDDSVDDLLQEVFLAFSHGAARITQPDRLRSYLMAAAVRQARQAIRDRSRRRRWLGLLAEDRRGASVPPTVHSRDALRRLRDILDLLPDRLRESFILRFVEELPTVDIAEIRGVSLATAKRDVAKSHDRVLFQARRDPALMDYLRGTGPASDLRDSEPPGALSEPPGALSEPAGPEPAGPEPAGSETSDAPSAAATALGYEASLDNLGSDEAMVAEAERIWSELDRQSDRSGVGVSPEALSPDSSRLRRPEPKGRRS